MSAQIFLVICICIAALLYEAKCTFWNIYGNAGDNNYLNLICTVQFSDYLRMQDVPE